MKLFVVRHGETDYNNQGRYAGSTDISLNGKGVLQAIQLADKLLNSYFDVVISSPLLRAKQTAEIVCKNLSAPLIVNEQFSERNVGVFEGLTREEAMKKYPDLWNRQCTSQLDDAPTDGETIRQVLSRVSEGLESLKNTYPDGEVLLICHGFVSRAVNKYCKGLTFDEMHSFTLGNCEIAEYKL